MDTCEENTHQEARPLRRIIAFADAHIRDGMRDLGGIVMLKGKASILFTFAKRCENPGDSRFWGVMNFFFCQAMIALGVRIYKKIKVSYPEKQFILISANSAGDVVQYGYFKDYLLEYIGRSENETVLLCSHNAARAVSAIGVADYDELSAFQIAAISMACHYYGREKLDVVQSFDILLFDYGMAGEGKAVPKQLKLSFDQEKIVKDLEMAGVEKEMLGHTVILSPYERSLSCSGKKVPDISFWEELTTALKSAGYNVCTNCSGGESEPPIAGTNRVFPSFGECAEMIAQAGAAIVLRSGFADFAALTCGTLVVLFPTEQFWNEFRLWN